MAHSVETPPRSSHWLAKLLIPKLIVGCVVLALFAVCTVVYGLLSSYPRELAVYSDELRYLDIARSLWQGRGLRVRNMPSDYQKILYPLCILPALALQTTAAQITAIGWLNAAWASSAVFPAWALCRANASVVAFGFDKRFRGAVCSHFSGLGSVNSSLKVEFSR